MESYLNPPNRTHNSTQLMGGGGGGGQLQRVACDRNKHCLYQKYFDWIAIGNYL